MGTYNILRAELECPRCGKFGNQQIDLGYVECELCKKDFFVKVEVRNDLIVT
jgi:hypothetical protein